ncbi:DUF1559 domain-containing protein [Paludisphaera sp.]|uniref:DUF1559 family PulG-like putative transporter n=1 Tax=Paludisphaera sp. TaxID=2017432 RepID=UPI00301CEE89
MPEPRPWTTRRIMKLAVLLLVPLAGFAWLADAVGAAREVARASVCVGKLKCIAVALLNYHDANGALPPAYSTDASGRPLLSWRVLILPYMEYADLYNRFRPDEPWDGPNNIRLLDEMPPGFACATLQPNVSHSTPGRFTNFLAAAGPGTAFPGGEPVKLADIKDGLDETILVVESDQAEVPWTAPIDLDASAGGLVGMPTAARWPTTPHPSGLRVATADGMIPILDPEKLRRELPAVASIAGARRYAWTTSSRSPDRQGPPR